MNILEHLGLALGLATVAGVNLYLTVLLTGLAVHFNFMQLADQYHDLAVLGHPWVIGVAAVMYVIEFGADKVPWLDSAWDAIHTFVRPVGGALMGMQTLGDIPPYVQVVAALLAGGAAFTTHSAKAGTRLMINHSPEPVSNIAMSVTEDVVVSAGWALMLAHPVIALVLFSLLLAGLWLLIPKLFGLLRSSFCLIRDKWRSLWQKEPVVADG